MKDKKETSEQKVFNYLALRFFMGVIAFLMPILVWLVAGGVIASISESVHSDARDLYVGMLFIVGAFLLAYKGHSNPQAIASTIGGLAAIVAAIFPTLCNEVTQTCSSHFTFNMDPSTASLIHNIAALILLGVLTFFCLFPFRDKAAGKGGTGRRRALVYVICGWIMAACIAILFLVVSDKIPEEIGGYRLIFVGEFVALMAFGIAWFVAGRWYRLSCLGLVDKNDDDTFRLLDPWKKSKE